MPAMPKPLLPSAAMIPEIAVPWPCSKSGESVGVVVLLGEVPAAQVVDVAVQVVVDAVEGLVGVGPDVAVEVGVGDTRGRCRQRRPGSARIPGLQVPGAVGSHVDALAALDPEHRLTGVTEAPLVGEPRVVGDRERLAEPVRLREQNLGVFLERVDPLRDRGPRRQLDLAQTGDELEAVVHHLLVLGEQGAHIRPRDRGLEADQELAGNEVGLRGGGRRRRPRREDCGRKGSRC